MGITNQYGVLVVGGSNPLAPTKFYSYSISYGLAFIGNARLSNPFGNCLAFYLDRITSAVFRR